METADKRYLIAQEFKYEGDDWWSWWIWIEGDDKDLDRIRYVVYTLHPTFFNPVRKKRNRKTKFRLKTEGWGVFTIYARIFLRDKTEIPLEHYLHLEYPDGRENLE
jgi:transcription initiation factor IIF auxiliary subunit